jgi:hypothetical protein
MPSGRSAFPGWHNVIADTTPALVKSLEWAILDEWRARSVGG